MNMCLRVSEDEIVLQPNNANSDGWFEDSATAAYDADLFEDETGKVMGAGVIRTDAGYFGGKSKAWTDIWFRTLFHTNVIGTLKFEGTVIYRWLAFTIGFQNSVSTSIGGLVAYRYIYNVDDDILTSIEFKDVDSAPTLDLMFIAWGLDEESAEYSEQIASYGFDEWKTYDLGVYMSAASNAANFARNLISCSWSLEEILFEVK